MPHGVGIFYSRAAKLPIAVESIHRYEICWIIPEFTFRTKMKFSLVCLAAASLVAAPAARAAVIVQTTSFDTTGGVIADTGVEHYAAISAYGFDPSLGTLDSVSFEYRGAISIGYTGGYVSYAPPPSGAYAGTASVTLVGDYPIVSTTAPEAALGVVNGTGLSVTAASAARFDVSGALTPASFIAMTPDALVTTLVDGPVGRLSGFSLTNAACNCALPFLGSYGTETIDTHAVFTLTYGYTPIPEPAALALFGSALAGLWAVRRRPA